MMQFAENFKTDNSESIIHRYPGSNRDTTNITDSPKSWPIRGSSTSTLETNIKPFDTKTNTRLELILEFSGSNNLGANSVGRDEGPTSGTLHVEGQLLVPGTTSQGMYDVIHLNKVSTLELGRL